MAQISREEFSKLYKEKFLPKLGMLELERHKLNEGNITIKDNVLQIIRNVFVLIFICFVSFIVIMGLMSSANLVNAVITVITGMSFMLLIQLLFAVFTVWVLFSVLPVLLKISKARKFSEGIKQNFLSILLHMYGNFSFSKKKDLISIWDIYKFGLYKKASCKIDDDTIVGVHNDSEIIINECCLNSNDIAYFSGLLVKVKMKKNFSGTTVVGEKKFVTQVYGMQKVQLESNEFEKYMSVYSTDQVEARYILTTGMIEKFNTLSRFGRVNAAFSEGYAYLFIPSELGKNYFEVPLDKPLLDENHFYNIFNEMSEIFSIIDSLNVNKDLGL